MVVVDEAIELTTDALKGEGAGVLTMKEVNRVLVGKIDVGRNRYITLGACNQQVAGQDLDGVSTGDYSYGATSWYERKAIVVSRQSLALAIC